MSAWSNRNMSVQLVDVSIGSRKHRGALVGCAGMGVLSVASREFLRDSNRDSCPSCSILDGLYLVCHYLAFCYICKPTI